MNGPFDRACDPIRDRLPLYAENELKDRAETERVRAHLAACAGCRGALAEYDEFTRVLLEAEHATLSLERHAEPWAGGGDAEGAAARDESEFAVRVMAAVSARRRARSGTRTDTALRRLAAILLVAAGLVAGAGVGFLARRDARGPVPAPAGLAFERGPSPSAPSVFAAAGESAGDPAEAVRDDSAIAPGDALWVIGPEVGSGEAVPLGMEAVLYGSLDGESVVRSRRQWLVLKAFLGDPSLRALAPRSGYSLLLLPEEGLLLPDARAAEDSRAMRPVAFPVRLAEDDLAPPARRRFEGRKRRYRILWAGDAQPPALLQPVYLPSEGAIDGPNLLPHPWTASRTIDWVPTLPERM